MKLLKRSLFLFSLPLATIGCLASINTAQAQISPDGTLSTTVTSPDGRNFTINDGNRAGGNLFHSFREFSVLTGGSAFFNNALDVQNIISRVTGGSVSNIDGLISANGAANLFLLNPAGVLFGPNASLNIGGSFLATTASSFVFPDGSEFSAINPQGAPLLTMNIPNGLRFRDNPGGIQVQGLGQTAGLIGTSVSFSNPTLEVPIGQTLALVGGNVSLDGGVLQAAGGRVEVGGLASSGDVEIQNDGVRPSVLLFPEGVQRADVTLTNQAGINTITDQFGGGSINITARNINISGRSLLTTGFFDGLGMVDPDVRAGDIVLNGIGETRIDESRIENNVNSGTTANGSNIFITTGSFVLNNNARLDASNFGSSGPEFAGDIRVDANGQINFDSGATISSDGFFGRIFLTSSTDSVNVSNSSITTTSNNDIRNTNDFSLIEITATQGSVSLNQATLSSNNSETGFAGDIRLNARDQLSIANSEIRTQGNEGRIFIGDANSFSPALIRIDGANTILSTSNSTAPNENAGFISLVGGSVVINQADLISSTSGSGRAGDISVEASGSVEFTDNAVLFSNVNDGAQNSQAGNITINAGSFSLLSGSQLQSRVVTNDDSLGTQGNSGNVTIDVVGDVMISGVSQNDGLATAIFTNVGAGASGDAGNITVTAGSFSLLNGAQLQSRVLGSIDSSSVTQGNSGNVTIDVVGDVRISGFNQNNGNPSAIFTDVEAGASGDAGSITITSQNGSVFLENGAELFSTNASDGRAGDIRINAINQISLNNSNIRSNGDFGQIFIGQSGVDTPAPIPSAINISGSQLTTNNSTSNGFAGDIFLNAQDQVSITNQSIVSSLGNFGRIFIGANTVSGASSSPRVVRIDNSSLSATNSNVMNAEDTQINSGDVSIDAIDSISLANQSSIETFTERLGNAGSVTLRVENGDISLTGGSNIFSTVEQGGSGDAGNIDVFAKNLSLANQSFIITSTRGSGNAGGVTLGVENGDIFLSGGSNIFSTVEQGGIGDAGTISITSRNLSLTEGSQLQTLVRGQGNAGSITIQATGNVLLTGFTDRDTTGDQGFFASAVLSRVDAGGIGNGGDITIRAGSLSLNDVSFITTSTSGQGASGDVSRAGNVSVQVDDSVTLANRSTIDSSVGQGGVGIGGDINIRARSLTLTSGAEIGAVVFRAQGGQLGGTGRAGNIDITATDFVDISGVSSVQFPVSFATVGFSSGLFASAERGTTAISPEAAGNITVTTGNFRLADGAVVNALTSNAGRGGNITITANNFTATGGGQVLATSRDTGRAGDITLNVSNRTTLSGSDPNFDARLAQAAIDQANVDGVATDIVNNQGATSGIFANTTDDSTAQGGTLTINTRELTVENGAEVTVRSRQGQAGNLDITARTIRLNNGSLTAQTGRGGDQPGANINLQGLELLSLRNGSLISAEAFGDANGGNINIDAGDGLVIATPRQNSDIIARASAGRGGNIEITAQAIFGIAEGLSRPANRTNDIDASSSLGPQFSGSVEFNTPDVDPSQGLVDLPENVIDPSQQIAQTPCQQGIASAFVITGRGGLPTSPNQTLSGDSVRVDLLSPVASTTNAANTTLKTTQLNNSGVKRIVPAQGWIFNEKGQVVLTAYKPNQDSSQRSWKTPTSCAAR